jgi:phage-related protein
MSKVLSLALKINADSSGLKLDPVQRALKRLGDETDKVTKVFDRFASTSEVAAKAQQDTAKALEDLTRSRKAGTISAEEFAREFERISEAAGKEAAALERAARVTEANLTPLQRFTRAQKELKADLDAGRITAQTYTRAVEGAAKGLTDAQRAAVGLGAAQKQIADSAASTTLKFNELSGVFAVLPGPLGSIAGRISGIASASEGLSRIFAGGLRSGISNLVGSFTALINPVTLALGGITAFAAGAASVARGLVSLEDRVEKLGNLADQLGTSFEFVQTLEEAGKRTGVSIEAVSSAFGKLQRTLADGGEEGEKANKALSRLGVTVDDLAGLSEDDKIRLLGRQIAAIEDPAERSAAAVALFGRQGLTLIPFFNNLERAEAAMQRFGAAISDVDKDRIDQLGFAFDDIGTALTGLGNALLVPFAGLVEGISNAIANAIGAVTNAIRPLLERITPALDALGQRFTAWGEAIFAASQEATLSLQAFGAGFSAVFDLLSGLLDGLLPGLQAYYDAIVSTVLQLAKVFSDSSRAILDAVNGLISAFAQLFGFGEGFAGVGEAIGAAFGKVYSVLSQVVTVLGNFIEVVNRVVTVVVVGITKAVEVVVRLVAEFLRFTGLGSLIQAIGNTILSIFGGISSIFSTIANAIGGVVGRLLRMAEGFLGIKRDAESAATGVETIADAAEKVNEKLAVSVEDQAKIAAEAERAAKAEKDRLETVNKIIKANEEQIRIQEQFGGNARLAKASDELDALEEESRRVQEALRAAREAGDQEAANAAASRLAVLDRVVEKQRETVAGIQEAAEQAALGFTQGFDSAFASVDRTFDTLSDKATQFGQEGFDAALRLKEGIEAAKEAVKDGILNREAFEREVQRQKKLFEDRVKDLQNAEKIAQDIAKREEKLRDRQFEIQREREEELANVRTGSIKVGDLRSGGISAFFDTLKEDPAIAEAKKQTRELEKVRKEIAKLNAEKVDILAGTG